MEKKTTPLALWVMERGNVAKEELVEQQFVKPYVQMDEMHIMVIPKTPFLGHARLSTKFERWGSYHFKGGFP